MIDAEIHSPGLRAIALAVLSAESHGVVLQNVTKIAPE
ncbi:hypothetical protein BOSE62_150436 [Bosea sp. 62]|nr:hypothetical protein BOSE46_10408 [Bosea sp. 46]CAD5250262.1 hypothetical protein BOSE21B_10621 [Bosea sp. 21B]CAD5265046.1 hypothetical protein BOSE7B_150517 [Bosea sp. 7B]VVT44379.1 hypothetical protein BOS5A_10452 [Bosea sp. EC-HK365B]VXB09447.1 hypothetical protein BOSE29B_10404 [Bosea sp. 29B]VXB83237.1 hypothetical protein BOSE62_150436 [Bosea sp. 62]VXC31649.1 hypothetical protein BOSE125_20087 [Bosea sp. 125]VXC45285.1 hypothetical protein BOSE127_190144 [Bosea sp. 127]